MRSLDNVGDVVLWLSPYILGTSQVLSVCSLLVGAFPDAHEKNVFKSALLSVCSMR